MTTATAATIIIAAAACVAAILACIRRMRLRKRLASALHSKQPTSWTLSAEALFFCLAVIMSASAFIHTSGRHNETGTVVFILDCSDSMLADTHGNTRLGAAKRAIREIARLRPNTIVGLITYAGSVFPDCPPTADRAAFLDALDAAAPGAVFIPGSAPELALQQAEALAPDAIVLLSDGEVNSQADIAEMRAVWQARQHPLAMILCGVPGIPANIPENSGLKDDPDTGTPAVSTPSPLELNALARLSNAPHTDMLHGADAVRSVVSFLARVGLPSPGAYRYRLLAALFFLIMALWLDPLSVRLSRRRTALVLLLGVSVQSGEPMPPRTQLPQVEHALRTALQSRSMPERERARSLSNLAAVLITLANTDDEAAATRAAEAAEACRHALRLAPGMREPAVNLEAALRILQSMPLSTNRNTPQEKQADGDNTPADNTANPHKPDNATTTPNNDNTTPATQTWRTLAEQQAEKQLKAAPPDVKPW